MKNNFRKNSLNFFFSLNSAFIPLYSFTKEIIILLSLKELSRAFNE